MKSADRSVSRSMSSFGTFLVKNKKKYKTRSLCFTSNWCVWNTDQTSALGKVF